jgi:serine-type D-Ala-D-Ala carboxypeptidase/endopeptidase (penicillin-binding protein 4)
MTARFPYIFLILVLAISCSPKTAIRKEIAGMESKLKEHTGFVLFDPAKKKNLVAWKEDRYFTPASNTKIYTFYAALKILDDSTRALAYRTQGDSLIFWGLGDPSFLYENVFQNGRTYQWLSSRPEKLFFSPLNFQAEPLGPGWVWSDYLYYYSAERTPFPIYGNLIKVKKQQNEFLFTPARFQSQFSIADVPKGDEGMVRQRDSNQLTYFPGKPKRTDWTIPYRYSDSLLIQLLADTLKRSVALIHTPITSDAVIFKSMPLDSVLRVMMQDSDNFIAEQLLLQCAAALSDTLNPEIAINYAKRQLLANLPDEPQWVDGSGLSRYNLFTPRSVTRLWEKIYLEVPQQRLFQLLAVGGKSGTIKNYYKKEPPFVFGKTGTLSNNHLLSGFVITRKGRLLIFSIMNNNYIAPTNEVRRHMEKILRIVYERY